MYVCVTIYDRVLKMSFKNFLTRKYCGKIIFADGKNILAGRKIILAGWKIILAGGKMILEGGKIILAR